MLGTLIDAIGEVHNHLTSRTKQSLNSSLPWRNRLIGRYIDESELNGTDRADCGDRLFDDNTNGLLLPGVSSTGRRQLDQHVAFYQTYRPIMRTQSAKLRISAPEHGDLRDDSPKIGTRSYGGSACSSGVLSQHYAPSLSTWREQRKVLLNAESHVRRNGQKTERG
jgi:hypothetical protein